MNVWIYNPNSSGGNYEYAINLTRAYNASDEIQCTLVVPKGSTVPVNHEKMLLQDVIGWEASWLRKLHFVWRAVANPLIMYRYLSRQKQKGVVLFNDYDQLTAPFWVPFYPRLKRRFYLGVVLHDPDRTNYPPNPRYSAYTMRRVLNIMDFALFHDHLPDLTYYQSFTGIKKNVPHGLYHLPSPDQVLFHKINTWKGGGYLLGILGNIREEKNYILAIRALEKDHSLKLIIAGQPANTSVPIREFQKNAEDLGVTERVFWHIGYMTEAEMSAVVDAVDLSLLYYSKTFTSQSGILNMLASRRKNVLISRTASAMTVLAEKYGFGTLTEPDDPDALVQGIEHARKRKDYEKSWEKYLVHADWSGHVQIIQDIYDKLEKDEALAG